MRTSRLAIYVLLFGLAACSGPSPRDAQLPTPFSFDLAGQDAETRAQTLIDQGQPITAAQIYLSLVGQAQLPAERHRLRLAAAAALLEAKQTQQARIIMEAVEPNALAGNQQFEYQRVAAEIALQRNQPQQALERMSLKPEYGTLTSTQVRERLELIARTYAVLGNRLDSVSARIQLTPMLADEAARKDNHHEILRTLLPLSTEALGQLQGTASTVLRGWLELARIVKSSRANTDAFDQALQAWQGRFGGHPASDTFIANLSAEVRKYRMEISQIAVLLPQSGPFAQPAQAIINGLLASHYAKPEANRPLLKFYDTELSEEIEPLYRRALAEGADVIVGPLRKPLVDQLAELPQLEVPVLALNFADPEQQTPPQLFQFSLSPEDEAREAAERAWLDGYGRALAIVPEGKWGKRVLAAFRQRWEDLGGVLLEHTSLPAKSHDFARPLRRLLDLDESYRRRNALQRVLGTKLKFEPKRRTDAELVFVAAYPRQARLLRPQLKFHYASDLPVYATSHIYSGRPDRTKDRDMNAMFFCDIPWVLPNQGGGAIQQQLAQLYPGTEQRFARLHAMGADAFTLLPNLRWLAEHPAQGIQGHTGEIYGQRDRRLHRRLSWSQFRSGMPRPAPLRPLPQAEPEEAPVSDDERTVL